MRYRGAERLVTRILRHWPLVVTTGILVVGVAFALAVRPWSQEQPPDRLAVRLEAATQQLVDYRNRLEVGLRLHLLEAEIADGRRSAALRTSYRHVDELMDQVVASPASDQESSLAAEVDGLAADLVRDRRAARERIANLRAAMRSWQGPGRAGDPE